MCVYVELTVGDARWIVRCRRSLLAIWRKFVGAAPNAKTLDILIVCAEVGGEKKMFLTCKFSPIRRYSCG